jgi:hypothetical protein
MTDLPSYKLVQRLMHESGFPVADPNDEMAFPQAKFMKLASRLIQYGADQELAACCEWLTCGGLIPRLPALTESLRAARRPEPPRSLKEQALSELNLTADPNGAELSRTQVELIRQALESL